MEQWSSLPRLAVAGVAPCALLHLLKCPVVMSELRSGHSLQEICMLHEQLKQQRSGEHLESFLSDRLDPHC